MSRAEDPFVRHFQDAIKKKDSETLGVEVEHFIVKKDTKEAVPYSGPGGVREILSGLMELYPGSEVLPDDDFFGFAAPEFTITLEPAAQMEISIEPLEDISEIGRIYEEFRNKLESVLEPAGLTALTVGVTPVSRVDDMELIPKERYHLMDEHFKTTGTGGRQMMRGTASLQVSIDYSSEEDFRRKLQAAYYYGPVMKLFCDNASVFQGEPLKKHLMRTDIWNRVDPNRCGILPGVFSETYGFRDYADFLWNLVPIFVKEGKKVRPTGLQTVAQVYGGKELTEQEILHVLSMSFPDVRLKQFLEIRFADCVPLSRILAYCALVKGLLCHEDGLRFAEREIRQKGLGEADIRDSENSLMEKGWDGSVYGRPVKELASEMLTLAEGNLPEEEKAYLKEFR